MGKAKIMLMMSLYYCALVINCLKIIVSCENVLEQSFLVSVKIMHVIREEGKEERQ